MRYDVVVVGAGAAGCVLAARLSEQPNRSVLLLEAGPDLRWQQAPPSLRGPSFNAARAEPERTWEQLVAVRAPGQPARPYIRGRGVGGSSVINAMVALAGLPDDYDSWERDSGCAGWGWREVEPWFAKVAVAARPAPRSEMGAINDALLRHCPEASLAPLTRTANGVRTSVVDSYLEPARDRPNLHVRANEPVDHVMLDGRRAVGVQLESGEAVEAAHVVIAAGAIHSPAILLRSAVDRSGIGANLHDHPSFPIPLLRHEPADTDSLPIAVTAALRCREPDDVQLLPMDHVDVNAPQLGLLMPAAMRVHSRGAVTLDADGGVRVDFEMLTDERDVVTLQHGIDASLRLIERGMFAGVAEALPVDTSIDGVRAALGDYVHAVGTCRMGAADDPRAVVDSRLRVIGYEGLSVCDASVMPAIPRANTHLPTLMIAERCAAAWA